MPDRVITGAYEIKKGWITWKGAQTLRKEGARNCDNIDWSLLLSSKLVLTVVYCCCFCSSETMQLTESLHWAAAVLGREHNIHCVYTHCVQYAHHTVYILCTVCTLCVHPVYNVYTPCTAHCSVHTLEWGARETILTKRTSSGGIASLWCKVAPWCHSWIKRVFFKWN